MNKNFELGARVKLNDNYPHATNHENRMGTVRELSGYGRSAEVDMDDGDDLKLYWHEIDLHTEVAATKTYCDLCEAPPSPRHEPRMCASCINETNDTESV